MNSLAMITDGYISVAGSVTVLESEPSIFDLYLQEQVNFSITDNFDFDVEESETISSQSIEIEIDESIDFEV